jgi:predicted TIM-barrel fold metal-dependent hydrolase
LRHPRTRFLLAHIGGGGDYAHTFPAVRDIPNISMDLSGSGIDRGMIEQAVRGVGADRLMWAADLTLCTGLTKLRALAHVGLREHDLSKIRYLNAMQFFPPGAFPIDVVKSWK